MPGASLSAAVRFVDLLDGTVKDNLTGLIWLKNANCFATLGGVVNSGTGLTWANALTWTNNLVGNNTVCGLNDGSTAGQWRLPNRKELMSLMDLSKSGLTLPTGYPFTTVQLITYWSGSTYSGNTTLAWNVAMGDGSVNYSNKAGSGYVWPVRAGQ
jgi:hypothetical protein